jgi:hypothetical protein
VLSLFLALSLAISLGATLGCAIFHFHVNTSIPFEWKIPLRGLDLKHDHEHPLIENPDGMNKAMKAEPANKLPIVALLCIAALILSGWLFFLATDELARINYRRKNNKPPPQTTPVQNQDRSARP